jgi:hypothetical protein
MSVGNVNSDAIGSGARYNDGKVPLDLLDVDVLWQAQKLQSDQKCLVNPALPVAFLSKWQHGGDNTDLLIAAYLVSNNPKFWPDGKVGTLSFGGIAWNDCAWVFEFGKKKYSEWNWSKGMAWSVPFGCAMRHLQKMELGQLIDDDSNLTHIGHFLANIVMLCTYVSVYPAGDDRPLTLRNVPCSTQTYAVAAETSTSEAGKTVSATPML